MFVKTAKTGGSFQAQRGFPVRAVLAVLPRNELPPESCSFLDTVDYFMGVIFFVRLHLWRPQSLIHLPVSDTSRRGSVEGRCDPVRVGPEAPGRH